MAELKLIKEVHTDLKKYNRYESIMGNNAFQVDWMIGNTVTMHVHIVMTVFTIIIPIDVYLTVRFIKR